MHVFANPVTYIEVVQVSGHPLISGCHTAKCVYIQLTIVFQMYYSRFAALKIPYIQYMLHTLIYLMYSRPQDVLPRGLPKNKNIHTFPI